MAPHLARRNFDLARSWDICLSKNHCRWPVIAGIIVAGTLIIAFIWIVCRQCCFRKKAAKKHQDTPVVSHPSTSPYSQEMQPPPYPNSPPEKAKVNGSSMQTKPGDADSLPLMPLYKGASQKELPTRPQEQQEMEIVPLHSISSAPAPTPSPNTPLPTYHANNRPMSRLTPLSTRNLHDSLLIYPPPQSVQQQHQRDKYATQDRSGDATPTESIPPQYYSPFSPPEKPYAHLSMQLPYRADSPVHREISPPFSELPATALGTYRAYSPALGSTQRLSNNYSPQLGPVELASPYNRQPQSIPLVPGGAFPSPTNESERALSPPPPLFETRKQQQARTLSPSPKFERRQQKQSRSLSPSPQFENRQQTRGTISPSPSPQFDNKKHQHA